MPAARVLFELTAPFGHPVQEVDARTLRAAFAELTDSALPQLNAAKLDLDDVLLEHIATFRDASDDAPQDFEVELVTLSDREIWLKAFDTTRESAGMRPSNPATTRIDNLYLRVLRETAIPVPDFSVE